MSGRDAARIRLGMAAFVLSGLLTVIGLWLRGPNPVDGHALDTAAFVRVSLDPDHNLTWALLLLNLVVQTYAWLALWGWLRGTAAERTAFWGAMLSIAGNGLFLPIAGVIALTSPAVARLTQAGMEQAMDVANAAVFGPLALPLLLASALALFAGAALTAAAIWRGPGLPRWAAVAYLLHALCLTLFAQVHYALEFAGAPLLLASGSAIAWAVWRSDRLPGDAVRVLADQNSGGDPAALPGRGRFGRA